MYPIVSDASSLRDVEDNYSTGFVRVYRSIQNKAWYKKSEYVHLWIHLFIKATRKPKDDWFAGGAITLAPGQLITGRKKLSDETGIQESKVERILKCFQNDQQIEQRGSSTSRLISINNWHLYQNVEQQNARQMNNERTTDEQRVNTIQEGKEYKEERDREQAPVKKVKFQPPTIEEVKAYFKENGYTEASAIKAFQYYNTAAWKDSKGNQVKNWKQKMISVWFKDENKIKEQEPAGYVDMDEYLGRTKPQLPY